MALEGHHGGVGDTPGMGTLEHLGSPGAVAPKGHHWDKSLGSPGVRTLQGHHRRVWGHLGWWHSRVWGHLGLVTLEGHQDGVCGHLG